MIASSESQVLLVSAHPPGGKGVGQLYLREISALIRLRLSIAALLSRGERYEAPTELEGAPLLRLERRFEPALRITNGWIGHFTASAGMLGALLPFARRLSRRIESFAERQKLAALIVVLDCPISMLLAAPLARRLGLPLVTLVWDMPECVLTGLGHFGASAAPIRRGFENAMRRSHRVIVMSEPMRDKLHEDFGAACVIVHQPVNPEWFRVEAMTEGESEEIVLGFAGSVTSKEEVVALLAALDSVGWSLRGRRVRLVVYGLRFVCQATTPQRIEFRGYLPETRDVVAGLAACDVLFLPQPFAEHLHALSRYSFPTKLTTYLAAGSPILLLAPEYSSLATFFRAQGLAYVCQSLESAAIVRALEELACNGALRDHAKSVSEQLVAGEFSPAVCRARLDEVFAHLPARAAAGQ